MWMWYNNNHHPSFVHRQPAWWMLKKIVAMFSLFNKNKAKKLFNINYCNAAIIESGKKIEFNLELSQDMTVEADTKMDAQVAFAKQVVLYPHICIIRIDEVKRT